MSDAIITEQSRSPSYKVAHFLTIEGVRSRIARKERFSSKLFSCVDEKNQSQFFIRLEFDIKTDDDEDEDSKWLSGFLFSKTRDVFVKKFSITVLDVHLQEQDTGSYQDALIKKGYGHGLPQLFDLTDFSLPDDTLCVRCEFTFIGASSGVSDTLSSRDINFDADLRKLLSDTADADVTIIVGKKTFKAHKALLKARSNYFRTLFESGMAESHSNEVGYLL